MNKYLVLLLFSLLSLSCKHRRPDNTATPLPSNNVTDSIPHIVALADLPDSLKPQARQLDKLPRPARISTAASKPVVKLLPGLTDEKGNTVKDKNGRPIVLGNGGMGCFTNFSTDNGLALDAVTSTHIDKMGNLWIGTFGGGVNRYDGTSFVTFTIANGLANNRVISIAEDTKGNIWFGTSGNGVSRYNGRSFTNYSTSGGLANDRVMCIAEDKHGNIWFGTDRGVSRYDGHAFTNFSTAEGLPGNSVTGIAVSRNGDIWFGTDGGGISCYNGKTFKNFSTVHGLADNKVWSIFEDKAGILWIGTNGAGVSRFDGKSFTTLSPSDGLAGNKIRKITADKNNNLWFGTEGRGVSHYNGVAFSSFTTAQGLANNSIWSITEDKEGNTWFGTWGGGISCYRGDAFTNFSVEHGLAGNFVLSIAEDKNNNIWFGTYGSGVSCYNGSSFTNFSANHGLANNFVLSIMEDRLQNIWFGTDEGGASCYDGKTLTTFTTAQGLPNNSIWGIKEDRNGDIWFATQGGGVSKYDGGSFTNFSVAQGLADISAYCIEEDTNGNLWFGTYSNGVSCYNGKYFLNFSITNGLANNRVLSILEDKNGNIWFGTKEGLSVLGKEDIKNTVGNIEDLAGKKRWPAKVDHQNLFKTFTKKDGLPDNYINQICELPSGKIAVGSNLGITILSVNQAVSSRSIKIISADNYNFLSGYPVKDVNTGQNCMFRDSKGIIWAGTGSEKTALVRFDPSALHPENAPPVAVIKSITIKEEEMCWYNLSPAYSGSPTGLTTPAGINDEVSVLGKVMAPAERDSLRKLYSKIKFEKIDSFYAVPRQLELPYEFNHIAFHYGIIDVSKKNELPDYQYILEGYNKEWSPALKSTTATFGNINEGDYTFKVRVRGANGTWGEPLTYNFSVLPPFYRTWWAYTAYFFLFLFAFRVTNKWRERNLRKEKVILEQRVKERTEELVQKNILVEKQKSQVEDEKKRSDALLRNILPEEVAEELKLTGSAKAKYFDNVTILFTDFVNFTAASAELSPQELIDELHACFKAFDQITAKYGIEKIKTIGDAYLAVSGLPTPDPNHAHNVIKAAIEISSFMQQRLAQPGSRTFAIRIGIDSGGVAAGIVGVRKFAYDIWGDTVNTAARMEQNSEPGKINISSHTYELTKNDFPFYYRGEIEAKGKGMLKMYYLDISNGESNLANENTTMNSAVSDVRSD